MKGAQLTPSEADTLIQYLTVNFGPGFSQATGALQLNGSAALDGYLLQLTNGGTYEGGSAFYTEKVNVQSFTTDFVFQLVSPAADPDPDARLSVLRHVVSPPILRSIRPAGDYDAGRTEPGGA